MTVWYRLSQGKRHVRRRYHWVLPTLRYHDATELLACLLTQIIAPAEQKAKELTHAL